MVLQWRRILLTVSSHKSFSPNSAPWTPMHTTYLRGHLQGERNGVSCVLNRAPGLLLFIAGYQLQPHKKEIRAWEYWAPVFLCSFLLPYRTREPISALNLICLWVPDSLANLFLIWGTEKASNYLYHLQLQSKPQARPLFLLPVAGKCCFVFLNKMSWVRSYHRYTLEPLFSRKGFAGVLAGSAAGFTLPKLCRCPS